MFLSINFFKTDGILKANYISDIQRYNELIKDRGLALTTDQAQSIIEVRNNVLNSYGRVDTGIEIVLSLIKKFSSSAFVNNENYVSLINELQELFYYIKNETDDKIPDEELISIIKDYYENECGGSIDLLKGRLEEYAVQFRKQVQLQDLI